MNTLIKRSFSIFCQKAFRPTHYLNFRTKFYNLSAKQQNTVINKELDELKRIPEFENAMSYALRQNYDLSKVYFLRLIEILNNQDSINPGIILLVLKKYSIVLRILEDYDELSEVLEQLYFFSFAHLSYNSNAFLPTLKNLFIHYSKFDLNKGIALSGTILDENSKNPIPPAFLKEIYLQIANVHTLKGEKYWPEAEKYYKEAFSLGLENKALKSIALNNLNCLKWWDFYSKFESTLQSLIALSRDINISDEKAYNEREIQQKKLETMQKDGKIVYNEIVKGFKSAMNLLEFGLLNSEEENLNSRGSPEEYEHTKLALDENEISLNFKLIKIENVDLRHALSSKIAMNLGEFLLQLGSFQEANFWLQVSLNSAAKHSMLSEVMRGMVLSAMIAQNDPNKRDFAEKLFKDCLDYAAKKKGFNTVFCLEMYSVFLNQNQRNFEASEYQQQAKNLREKYHEWEEKLENMILNDYDLNF